MVGRRVLITGGTGQLGRVIADTLAQLGASIVILDRPGSAFAALEKHLSDTWKVRCVSLPCNLEIEQERLLAIDILKSDGKELNCLINNAAFVGSSDLKGWNTVFAKQSLATWRRALEVNLTAPFHLAQGLSGILYKSKGANIINISSIYGKFGPDRELYKNTALNNPAAYAVSKGGLITLTTWLAASLAPSVRVNAILPGGIKRNQPKTFQNRYVKKTLLKRMACETDLAGAVVFLASDLSEYMTGQFISVDGGWNVK